VNQQNRNLVLRVNFWSDYNPLGGGCQNLPCSPAALFSSAKDRESSLMSGPSRRPEIRRRRTRQEKIQKLRKRLAAATTDADRSRILAKLQKLNLVSPGIPLVK
jgi:uncharacterized protein DUF6800